MQVTKTYHDAITQLLKAGVRLMAMGAHSDEVVPLFSGCFEGLHSNPALLRAVYFHAPKYRDEFLTDFVG